MPQESDLIRNAAPHPLLGRRILLTRTLRQNSELASRLAALGAETLQVPLLEIMPPSDLAPLDQVLYHWPEFEVAVFTSANGVHVFFARRQSLGLTIAAPAWICAVGPVTARALENHGWKANLIPEEFVAESAAQLLAPLVTGRRVVSIQAAEARGVLERELTHAGAQVVCVAAYQTRLPAAARDQLLELLPSPAENGSSPKLDAILLTSALAAQHLAQALGADYPSRLSGIALGTIGPITRQAIESLGLIVAFTAHEYTAQGLVTALLLYYHDSTPEPKLAHL